MRAMVVTARSLAIAGVIACGLGASANAATFFDVNFDNVTAQTYLSGGAVRPDMVEAWSAAGGMTKMTDAYGGSWPWSGVQVQGATSGFGSQSLASTRHPQADAGPVRLGTTAGNAFTGTSSGQYEFTFEISLPDTAAFTTLPGVFLLSSTGTQHYTLWDSGIDLAGEALLKVTFTNGIITATGGDGSLTLVPAATVGTPYSIKAIVDMDANTVQYSVDNGAAIGTLTQLQAKDGHGIMGLGVDGGHAPSGDVSAHYDNFKLASVPEPMGMALLGLGSLTALRRRRQA